MLYFFDVCFHEFSFLYSDFLLTSVCTVRKISAPGGGVRELVRTGVEFFALVRTYAKNPVPLRTSARTPPHSAEIL